METAAYLVVSLDPIHNKIQAYDSVASERINRACASLMRGPRATTGVYLGKSSFNATVYLQRGDTRAYQTTPAVDWGRYNRKPAGRRDVALIPRGDSPRTVRLWSLGSGPGDYHILYGETGRHPLRFGHRADDPLATGHDILVEPRPASDEAKELWQWNICAPGLDGTPGAAFNAPVEGWRLYSPAVSAQLSAHFADRGDVQATAPCAVEIGCRQYEVRQLEGGAYALQVDEENGKRRLVRRVRMNRAEEEARRAQEAGEREGSCALCLDEFGATRELHTVELPCKHHLHAVCAQGLADQGDPCPLCRAEVANWPEVMGSVGPRAPS